MRCPKQVLLKIYKSRTQTLYYSFIIDWVVVIYINIHNLLVIINFMPIRYLLTNLYGCYHLHHYFLSTTDICCDH